MEDEVEWKHVAAFTDREIVLLFDTLVDAADKRAVLCSLGENLTLQQGSAIEYERLRDARGTREREL